MSGPRLTRLLAWLILAVSWHQAGAAAPVRIAYVSWSSSVASANVACAVIRERLGRDCQLDELTADRMWAAVADGEADAMLSAWLPDTHREYIERFGDRMVDLGANLEGTRTGLVVPDVSAGRQTGRFGARGRQTLSVKSIGDLRAHRDAFSGRIVGIDPAAGIMRQTREAMKAYGLTDWRLVEGSEHRMTQALTRAIQHKEPIVVTGWTPHWMFGRWALTLLDDPKGVYGQEGAIHTMARTGLADEMPKVYRFLERFHWGPQDMEQLMLWIEIDKGLDPYGKAVRWIRAHPAQVSEWLD